MYILHKDGHLELVERAFKVRGFILFSSWIFVRQYYGACQMCFVTKPLSINVLKKIRAFYNFKRLTTRLSTKNKLIKIPKTANQFIILQEFG